MARQNHEYSGLTLSIFSLVFAFIIGAVIIGITGYSPFGTYYLVFKGAFGSFSSFLDTLTRTSPLLFSGIAFLISLRAGIINIGVEGQIIAGAFVSAVVGAYLTGLPPILISVIAILAGMAAGGGCALFIAWLKVKFNTNVFITSIMFNSIIVNIANYFASGPLRGSVMNPQTKNVPEEVKLYMLSFRNQLTIAIFIALAVTLLVYILFRKTPLGYEMKILGYNSTAAKTAGIKTNRVIVISIVLSGLIGGLCGSTIALGSIGKYVVGLATGVGYEGIAVAAAATGNPLLCIVSSVIFAGLKAGALKLNMLSRTPVEYVGIIQALVVISIAAPKLSKKILDGLSSLINPITSLMNRRNA